MANNAEIVLKFKVAEDGSLILVTKNIDKASKATKGLAQNQREAANAADEHNYTLNQGVTGVSSASRSFSKLSQTIGRGPNGLVGAYATLAANAFAVSAAFSALRDAAQVEQMMKGLEAQSARTGKNLTGLAQQLKEITNYAISSSEAMQATALMSSAGFSSQGMKELVTVANNAALALGRNVPDALDRISKGVTKLEPELLDELGIMTKLTEAYSRYALENSKTADSLTSFEKRQALLNAVVSEGTAKFGGLSEEVEANPYDKLGAAFSDLTKEGLGFVNTLLGPMAEVFSAKGLLLGGIILFGSTIRKQLLPALYLMGKVSREMRDEHIKEAESIRETARANLEKARSSKVAAIEAKKAAAAATATKALPRKFDLETAASGTLAADQAAKEVAKLESSIKRRQDNIAEQELKAAKGEASWSREKIALKKVEVAQIQATKNAIEDLYAAQASGEENLTQKRAVLLKSNAEYYSRKRMAQAADLKAQAVEAAGAGDLSEAWRKASESVRAYEKAVKNASRAGRVGEDGTIDAQSKLGGLMDSFKVLGNRVTTFASVGAAAFMKFIPYLGWAQVAVSALWNIYEKWGKSEAAKAQSKALLEYKEAVDNAIKSSKELRRVQASSIDAGVKAGQSLTIQANATRSISDAMETVIAAQKKVAAGGKESQSALAAFFAGDNATIAYDTGIEQGDAMFSAIQDAYGQNSAKVKATGAAAGALMGAAMGATLGSVVPGIGTAVGGLLGASLGAAAGTGMVPGLVSKVQALLPEEFNGIDEQALETARSVSILSEIIGKDLTNSFYLAAAAGGTLEDGQRKVASSPALQREFIRQAAKAYEGLAEAVKELNEAYKQAGDAANEFITSAIPKTSYDGLLKSTRGIVDSLSKIDKTIGATQADKLALLTNVPEEYKTFLDVKSQKLLQEVDAQAEIYQSLKAQVDQGKTLSESDNARLNSAREFLNNSASQATYIQKSIEGLENTLAIYQRQEVTAKNQAQYIQAIVSANQEVYSSGAAGEKAKIEREEQIRDLQITQLQAQKAMIDATIAQAEASAAASKAELNRLATVKEITREYVNQGLKTAEEAARSSKTTALSRGVSEGSLGVIEGAVSGGKAVVYSGKLLNDAEGSAGAAARAYEATYKQYVTAKKLSDTYELNIKQNRTISNLKMQSESLEAQINALSEANLTIEQKRARMSAAKLRVEQEVKTISDKIEDTKTRTRNTEQEINDLLLGRNYTAGYEASRRELKLKQDIAIIERERDDNLKDLNSALAKATADRAAASGVEVTAYDELIKTIKDKIKLERESANSQIAEASATARKVDLEEILFDTKTKGLEIQQQALEVLQKETDLAGQLLSKTQELRKARREAAAARLGTEISSVAQKAEEYRSAVEQYKLAEDQLALKKVEIELEYSLLEAKRLLLEQELSANKKKIETEATILRSKAASETDPNKKAELTSAAGNLDTMASQLGTAYESIHKYNYEALKQNALKIAEMDVEILRQRAMKAYYDMVNSILPENPAAKMMQGVRDAVEIFKTLDRVDMDIEKQLSNSMDPALQAQEDQIRSQKSLTNKTEGLIRATIDNTNARANPPSLSVETTPPSTIVVGEEVTKPITTILQASLSALIPRGPITSGYGSRAAPTKGASTNHMGVDVGLPQGTPIYAPEAGIVQLSKTVGGYGKRVELNLGTLEGSTQELVTTYSHLSRLAVEAGQRVEKGQLLGFSGGARGTPGAGTSTGAHLHFETLINGEKVDPRKPTVLSLVTQQVANDNTGDIVVTAKKETEAQKDKRLIREDEINASIMEARKNIDTNAIAIEDRIMKMALGIRVGIQSSIDALKELGPQGQAVASMAEGISNITLIAARTTTTMKQTYEDFHKEEVGRLKQRAEEEGKVFDESTANLTSKAEFRAQKMAGAFASVSAIIGAVASIVKASSDAKIASIDKEIAAEQKRDGKSAQSLAKIDAMEKKKDAMARKAFNTNKKLMMAQAVMSTAAAVAQTLGQGGWWAIPLAIAVGAMGAAQLAIIAGTQYESSYSPGAVSAPSSLSIGKRGESVDLAKGPNVSAGGEIGYLRGMEGTGANASNYRTVGSAYGGDLMRGYGNRGFVVGEKGPEVISPETPVNVTPASDINGNAPVNATINIQAIDSQGVQDVLVAQKGNIIQMLREAANSSGQRFLEDVNVNVYTRPNVGRL